MNEDFWKYIQQFDIVRFQETCLDGKGWKVIEGKFSKNTHGWLNTREGIPLREETWEE